MTYELNDAFSRAARDDAVRVSCLPADGPHFSAGHDLTDVVCGTRNSTRSAPGGSASPAEAGSPEEEIYSRCATGGAPSRSRRSPPCTARPSVAG